MRKKGGGRISDALQGGSSVLPQTVAHLDPETAGKGRAVTELLKTSGREGPRERERGESAGIFFVPMKEEERSLSWGRRFVDPKGGRGAYFSVFGQETVCRETKKRTFLPGGPTSSVVAERLLQCSSGGKKGFVLHQGGQTSCRRKGRDLVSR